MQKKAAYVITMQVPAVFKQHGLVIMIAVLGAAAMFLMFRDLQSLKQRIATVDAPAPPPSPPEVPSVPQQQQSVPQQQQQMMMPVPQQMMMMPVPQQSPSSRSSRWPRT